MTEHEKKVIARIIGAFLTVVIIAMTIKTVYESANKPVTYVYQPTTPPAQAPATYTPPTVAEPDVVTEEKSDDPDTNVDEEWSREIEDYLYSNFGGNGNDELAVSWYNSIQNVEAEKSGSVYVYTSLYSKESNKKVAESIANSILFWVDDVKRVYISASDDDYFFSKSK